MRALELANGVRKERAVLKRELKAGVVTGSELLLDPRDCMWTLKVADFLSWLPRVGRWRATVLMRGLVHSSGLTIEQLGERRRRELAERITAAVPAQPAIREIEVAR